MNYIWYKVLGVNENCIIVINMRKILYILTYTSTI